MFLVILCALFHTVRNSVGFTKLHKIVVVYKGMDMLACEEV